MRLRNKPPHQNNPQKMARIDKLRESLLDEMKLPDFKGRHLFVAKLRLIVFVLCWLMFVGLYPQIWKVSPFVPLVFNIGFFITAICYHNIVREKYVLSMSVLEVLADVVSQTSLIYILGTDSAVVFLFYGLYVMSAGAFFGYITALVAGTAALLSYCFLLFSLQMQWIDPFIYPRMVPSFLTIQGFGYVFNLICLPVALGVIVYGAKIAHYFSKIKERALETRNVQLLALNRIGSTIRRTMDLQSVIDQVLKGVVQGLGFDICLLALLDRKEEKIRFYIPRSNKYTARMEEIWGHSLADLYLPLHTPENSAYQSIRRNCVIIRNNFTELTHGLIPEIGEARSQRIQQELGFHKFVITPLVAERKVMGALIGASRKTYVEESVVDTLDNFANQAALTIESAQLIEELQQKNIELKQANKIKSDFLAIMSHELRTPLTAIMGYSEILLEKVVGELNKEQEDSLNEVLKNAEDLLHLINNILDLAKVEAGRLELSSESFSVEDIINEVNQTVAPLAAKKNLRCIVSVDSDLPPLHADPRKLRQVLLNLVGNAIKFTPDQGQIEITARYYRKADVLASEFRFSPERFVTQGVFRFSVKDSGIGIEKENLSDIFDIFQQVDSTFTRKYQGTGLGLALSKQLVELHDGVIAVSSIFGQGSEFKFILPESVRQKETKQLQPRLTKVREAYSR